MIHTVNGFSVVSEAEVNVFLELSYFIPDPMNVGNLISSFSVILKPSLYIWKFSVHMLLKPSLKDFEHNLASMWASLVAQRLNRLPAMRETQVLSLGWEDPLEKQMATHSSTLAWRIPWREEPGPWGCKELGTTGLLHFHFSGPFAIWPFVFPRSRTLRKSER